MQLLMSADQHGKWPVFHWLLTVARDCHVDAIVLAGDLLGCPDGFDTPEEAQRHDANRVNELLASTGIPVFYVMGNDDLVELNSTSDQVQSVHQRQVRWGRFTIVGYQYSLPFMGGTFEKPDEAIAATPFFAHIHGHSHGGFGRSGKHFNVASGGRRRAMVLDTESMTHEVLNVDRQERDA